MYRTLGDGGEAVTEPEPCPEAFDQACVLRRWYYLLSIEGPEGQHHEAEAITEWCMAHSK
jgi:hypothetical protein